MTHFDPCFIIINQKARVISYTTNTNTLDRAESRSKWNMERYLTERFLLQLRYAFTTCV